MTSGLPNEPRWRRYLRFWKPDLDADIDDELRFHLEQRIAEYERQGLAPGEAERAARERLGDLGAVARTLSAHDAARLRHTTWRERLERFATDLRLALRGLRRAPSFATTAILVVTLGVGLATAVFSIADAMLLRPLPVTDQGSLVVLQGETRANHFPDLPFSFSNARAFSRETRTLSRVAMVGYEGAWPVPVRAGDRVFALRRALVSGNWFDVLGAAPLLGRTLRPADDVVGAAPAVVLSYDAWRRSFGGDSAVVGHVIALQLDGVSYRIVGVMPRGLDYPRGTDFWSPLVPARAPSAHDSTTADVHLLGRIARGATVARAQNEATAFLRRHLSGPNGVPDVRAAVRPLSRVMLGDTRAALFVFTSAALLLLLVTCVNTANLLLVRGVARAREIAVRSALGAPRGRVLAQLVTENAVVASAGGIAGLALAAALIRLFVRFAPVALPRLDEVRLDGSSVVIAGVVTAVALLLAGIAPAVVTAHHDLVGSLRAGRGLSVQRSARTATRALVVGQIAMAVTILAVAGLLANSFARLSRADLGFVPSHLLVAEPAIRYDIYDHLPKQVRVMEDIVAGVRSIPGVLAVSPVVAVPFSGGGGWDARFRAPTQSAEQARNNTMFNMDVVSPSYFRALDLPILRGRAFTDDDRPGSMPVVVVSRSVAREFWPGVDPLGQELTVRKGLVATVVGVVPDTRYRDLREARPSVYFPLRQNPYPYPPMTLVIRTAGAPSTLVPVLRRALSQSAPGVALERAEPFTDLLAAPLALPRLGAFLLAIFAASALLLAAAGLYAVISAAVRQRTSELGIRLALGATPAMLRAMVMREATLLSTAGIILGVGAAVALSRTVRALLFQVSPTDPATLAAISAILLITVLGAAFAPARRAGRTDPVDVLRSD